MPVLAPDHDVRRQPRHPPSGAATNEFPRVCIIGAGPVGLLCLKHLTAAGVGNVVCYDAQEQVGGLWNYSDQTEATRPGLEKDAYFQQYGHIQSSFYENQLLNVPRVFQQLKDFPQPESMATFPHRAEWRKYLGDYAEHFQLPQHVRLGKFVKGVQLTHGMAPDELPQQVRNEGQVRRFLVSVVDAKAAEFTHATYETFDWVVIANGHNSKPHIPSIPGQEEFEGAQMHMHTYRRANTPEFQGKTVLVLGGSWSTTDMLDQFFRPYPGCPNPGVKKVILAGSVEGYVSNTDFEVEVQAGKLKFKPGRLQRLRKDQEVVFGDGTSETVDTILYATGYEAHYPFLHKEDGLVEVPEEHRGKYVSPLYKRMFCINEPRLCFTGLIDFTPLTFHAFEKQAMVLAAAVGGRIKLPSAAEMTAELNEDIALLQDHKQPLCKFNCLPSDDIGFSYLRSLHSLVKEIYPANPRYDLQLQRILCQMAQYAFKGNWQSYRAHNYIDMLYPGFKNTTEFF